MNPGAILIVGAGRPNYASDLLRIQQRLGPSVELIDATDGHLPERIDVSVSAEVFSENEFSLNIQGVQDGNGEFPSVDFVVHEAETGEKFARLCNLQVPFELRKNGLASLLVKTAIAGAEKHSLRLYVDAVPFHDRPMSVSQLRKFYMERGFRSVGGHPTALVYEPGEMGVNP